MAATSTVTTLHSNDLRDALDAVEAWESVLRTELIERDEAIHVFALALAAREHLFMLSLPGNAKTLLFDRAVAHIAGCRSFKENFGELSTPEMAYGPWSMQGLMKDQFRRVTRYQDDDGNWHETNWSQNCHLVLWDEAYKASVALTNTALMMMNERQLADNGIITQVPLATFVVASNEERKSEEQLAFDDRIPLRLMLDRVRDHDAVIRLLKLPEPDPNPTPSITWAQWEVVQEAVNAMPVADEVYEMIVDIERELLAAGIDITPRRLRKCVKIVKAEALLDGAAQVETEHVAILEHCAWLSSADQPKAQQIVLAKAAPVRQAGLALLSSIEAVGVSVDQMLSTAAAANKEPDTNEAAQYQAELKSINRKVKKLAAESSSSKRSRDLVDRCRDRQRQIAMRLLTEAFDISPDAVQAMLAKERD